LTHIYRTVLLRELRALRREVEAYDDEAQLWSTPGGVSNSAGNLVLHLCGNLQHFVGAKLGSSGYVRNRDAEFATRGVSRAELLAEIDRATTIVDKTLASFDDARLDEAFPETIAGTTPSTREWLAHLSAHLAYHLGQIDYHRRIVTGDSKTLDVISVKELPSRLSS
jgi:hypothetical protein